MNFSYHVLKLMSTLHLKRLQPNTEYSLIYELHQSLIVFRCGKFVKKNEKKSIGIKTTCSSKKLLFNTVLLFLSLTVYKVE